MTAPTYDQLVAAIDRVVAAHYAEADDDQGVTAVLREIEASIEAAADLAARASRSTTSPEAAKREARRLSEPTGQPVEPDPDSRPPAHAGSPNRTPSTLTPLT